MITNAFFGDMFDTLIAATNDEWLKEEIAFYKDRLSNDDFHPSPEPGHGFHPIYKNAFTLIANLAKDIGEDSVCRIAREMRDEIQQYIEES